MDLVYTQSVLGLSPVCFTQGAAVTRGNAALKDNDMQRCSTGCRMLLIMLALLILLQMAIALHHQHFESCYDGKGSLHSFPTVFCPDHIKLDTLICLTSKALLPPPSCLWIRSPDSPEAPITILITAPSQSRAPPISLLS